ncbi:MAG TPA: MsnO8 family LLM class oxidoreductase, partial [Paenibacillus sp.]|nr:MsnO8 family LLM class oxidoreductase [Paenibacillus sp.]
MTTSRLSISVLDLVPAFGETSGSGALREAIALAQAAERFGYRRYWAAEHHDLPGLACPAPEVLLAAIGARTSRIRLGTGALLLPHYKPLKVAETFHLLASLYPGRIDLGIGRAPGGNAHASMALSGNFLDNVRRLPEALRDVAALVRGDYAYEGQPVRARPTPPHPPELWLLGTNAKSAAYAAELGMGYVFGQFMSDTSGEETLRAYREAFAPSAFRSAPRAIVAVAAVCADTAEEARELASLASGFFGGAEQPSAPPAS